MEDQANYLTIYLEILFIQILKEKVVTKEEMIETTTITTMRNQITNIEEIDVVAQSENHFNLDSSLTFLNLTLIVMLLFF